MTRTSDTFGALALTALTVFALWSSTLAIPFGGTPAAAAPVAVTAPAAV